MRLDEAQLLSYMKLLNEPLGAFFNKDNRYAPGYTGYQSARSAWLSPAD